MKIEPDTKLSFDDVLIKPCPTEISSRADVNLIVSYIGKHANTQIRGCPIIVSNLDTTGTISMAKTLYKHDMFVCLHKYIDKKTLFQFFNNDVESSLSFYTIGVNKEDIEHLKLVKQNSSYLNKICIDAANGYMYSFLDTIKYVRTLFPDCIIMAGNVCTPDGVENTIKAGADICKGNIGVGALCNTTVKTGVGYSTFSAAIECSQAANELNALYCSDGGCKTNADICKSFCAGSHFVMSGSMFLGYKECEAETYNMDGVEYMKAYGMSSKTANDKYNGGLKDYRTSEGKEINIPYHNHTIDDLARDIKGSLASCCAYQNVRNLENISKHCVFTRVK